MYVKDGTCRREHYSYVRREEASKLREREAHILQSTYRQLQYAELRGGGHQDEVEKDRTIGIHK